MVPFEGKLKVDLFERGKRYAVAVSGGADSMALLVVLNRLSGKLGFSLFAVNVDHMIRKEASKADSDFVQAFCEKHGISFIGYREDVRAYAAREKLGLEEAARNVRRSIFQSLLNEGKCDAVCLAHHRGDNAETLLLHVLRGAGLNGASGIAEAKDGILRPMLQITKEEILTFVKEEGIPFVTDESNLDNTFDRNYVRNVVLPVVSMRFPSAEEALARFAETAREDEDFLNELAKSAVSFGEEEASVDVEKASVRPIAFRAIKLAISHVASVRDFSRVHFEALFSLMQKGENGSGIDLPNDVRAMLEYGSLTFFKEDEEKEHVEIPLKEGSFPYLNGVLTIKRGPLVKEKGITCVDADRCPEGCVIRARREQDVFFRTTGRKKVKDFLIDRKIPRRKRDFYPVLCYNEKVFAVIGLECGNDVRVTDQTQRILQIKLTVTEEENETGH